MWPGHEERGRRTASGAQPARAGASHSSLKDRQTDGRTCSPYAGPLGSHGLPASVTRVSTGPRPGEEEARAGIHTHTRASIYRDEDGHSTPSMHPCPYANTRAQTRHPTGRLGGVLPTDQPWPGSSLLQTPQR